MGETTQHRLLALAIERFGREDLAKRLKTSPVAIDSWRSGEAGVPTPKMLAIVDLLDALGALGDAPKS